MDPLVEAGTGDATGLRAELQALMDAVAALPDHVPAGFGEDLHDLIILAEHASDRDESHAALRILAYLALLRPRLTRLGDAQVASTSDMPLRQVADLVHRIRIELAAILEAQTTVELDDGEDERGCEAR